MTPETLVAMLALVGLVIIASALLSGATERTGLPPVVLFLGIGALLGPIGLGMIAFEPGSAALQVISVLALVLVLFSDAMTVDPADLRRHRTLAWVVLGPGTIVPAAIIAAAAFLLLDVSLPAAAILGAALASTDPVMLRGLLRRSGLPAPARAALRLESGLNDIVLLPAVVIAMLFLGARRPDAEAIAAFAGGMFILGPIAGIAVGFLGIKLLELMRAKYGIRRDYESLYALGIALTAFAAAEAVHGSGFLAAFAAGLTIAMLDVELCDCFTDYGQATAEMFLLLTFVAFGAGLIWRGLNVISLASVIFAVIALVARTIVLWPGLRAIKVDSTSARIIALYGPRGLSALLLVLLPVFAGAPGAAQLFDIAALTVLMSLVVHGVMIALPVWRDSMVAHLGGDAPDAAAPAPAPLDRGEPVIAASDIEPLSAGDRISIAEFRERVARGEPASVGDVRTERSYEEDPRRAKDAVRILPDNAVETATRLAIPKGALLALYCT